MCVCVVGVTGGAELPPEPPDAAQAGFIRAKLAGLQLAQQIVEQDAQARGVRAPGDRSERRKRLIDVCDDVVDVFNAHRNAHQVL